MRAIHLVADVQRNSTFIPESLVSSDKTKRPQSKGEKKRKDEAMEKDWP